LTRISANIVAKGLQGLAKNEQNKDAIIIANEFLPREVQQAGKD
jgi:hypothetical protein